MRFSVIIPLYRSRDTLARAIASVLAQTLPAHEIILVADDGEDYHDFAADARVRLLSTGIVGSGAGNARNIGIRAATGDAIALLDADDAFHPARLAALAPLVKKYGAAFTGTRYIDDATGTELPNINFMFEAESLSPLALALSGMHTHVHVAFDRVRCPALNDVSHAAQDSVFMMKLYDYVDAVGYTNAPLYDYYRSAGSFCTQQGSAQKFVDFIDDVLDPQSEAYAAVSKYKAFEALRLYLECMREAEIEVITNSERPFQEIMRARAEETLWPQIKG